jgi:hypothetical protein
MRKCSPFPDKTKALQVGDSVLVRDNRGDLNVQFVEINITEKSPKTVRSEVQSNIPKAILRVRALYFVQKHAFNHSIFRFPVHFLVHLDLLEQFYYIHVVCIPRLWSRMLSFV